MKSKFDIISWDEAPYIEEAGKLKFTKVCVEKKYLGRLQGDAKLEYLMVYYGDGEATFVGVEHFEGNYGDKQGSIAFEHKGVFKGGKAKSVFTSIKESGLDGLRELKIQGEYTTGHSMSIEFDIKELD